MDARRIAAELLDDVLRHGERVDGSGVSNAAVAESLALGESRVRRFRDPHEDATVSLADLLLLPEAVARPLLAALRARRRELYGEPAAPSTREDQAHVTLATAGATIQCLAQALTDGVITDEEAPRIAAQARASPRAHARPRTARHAVRRGGPVIRTILGLLVDRVLSPSRLDAIERRLAVEIRARTEDTVWLRRELGLHLAPVELPTPCYTCGATHGREVARVPHAQWSTERGDHIATVRVLKCVVCGNCRDAPTEGVSISEEHPS